MKKEQGQKFTIAASIRASIFGVAQTALWRSDQFTHIVDFGYVTDSISVAHHLKKITATGNFSDDLCIRMMLDDLSILDRLVVEAARNKVETIILALPNLVSQNAVANAREIARQVFVEVYSEDNALELDELNPDGFVIRGNEAGGICGNTSNPTLLRRIRPKISQPIWIYGGIGVQSTLAYAIGGADGVIFSDSLLLMPEVIEELKEHDVRSLKGGVRTQSIDIGNRMHMRVSEAYPELIQQIRGLCVSHDRCFFENDEYEDCRIQDLLALVEKNRTRRCFIGEEIAWAAELSMKYDSIGSLAGSLRNEVLNQLKNLRNDFPFRPGSALSKTLNAEYPLLQGPMTHVSDEPDFLVAVAQNGAVPFAALGTMDGNLAEELLSRTHEKIGERPWGVGIIGFAPKEVQDAQFKVIEKYKPNMAIVAGGRPQHYKTLREMGIMPFVHIPVPSMIASFFKEGVRHFIFEGRGCGGHIGPINSYTLWQSALIEFQKLAEAGQDLSDVRIALAGGIYDAVSAAMTSAFTVPLLGHGVQFCFIVGTAYLFTREIIQSQAISPVFQKVALVSDNTVVMEGAAGHALRCAHTPLILKYRRKRIELMNSGLAQTDLQLKLEDMNIGRLRLASKGMMFKGITDGKAEFEPYSEADQEKQGLYMIGEVANLMDQPTSMADLHRTICADAATVLEQRSPIELQDTPAEKMAVDVTSTDIAIIGMSAMVPGADNLDEFWHNVLAQVYCITDVPDERWQTSVNYHSDPDHKDTCYSKKGGFLGEFPVNSMTWGIPPGSMKNVDPAQLIALEAVRTAIRDAGYENREFDRERTSVIFGFAGGGDLLLSYSVRAALKEYMHRAEEIPDDIRSKVIESVNEVLPEWTEDTFPGILGNIIAGRVANRFNLNGLNFTLDAACASSMAALKIACQELAYGTTRNAIVGGVDASQHPFGFTCFSKTKALSLTDQSKPFSDDADGIILGEGVGVVVLKRLADAVKDNDRVYAVIKGIGGASDGKGSGMTVPVQRGQKLAVERAYEVAGFKTDTVDLIEAHGTGTPLGDRVELEALNEVLLSHGATQPCAVGSIKSAIGHTKGAAGIIGVIKAAMALHHKVLPAHVNVEKVHKAIVNDKTKLYLNTDTRPWFRRLPDLPRRAGASAFGFGGTNFHTVLEEYAQSASPGAVFPSAIWPTELFLFSAKDTESLVKRIDATLALLEKTEISIARFAHTHYRHQLPTLAGPVRLAVKADSVTQLKERLAKCKSLTKEGKFSGDEKGARKTLLLGEGIWGARIDGAPGPLTALFPGQGAQKLNMLKDLALVFPIVRECLDDANAILEADFFPASENVLTDYIFPPPSDQKDAEKLAMQALTQTTVAQPALGAVEIALYRLLLQFNVRIDMTAGHSFGELTALWAAGVLTDRQLLTLAGTRGRCMAGSSDVPTGMTAVQTRRETLKEYVDGVEALSIANHNTPKQVVVSGSIDALEQFEVWCRDQKLGFKRLPVSQGFHSPFMEKAANQWQAALALQSFLPSGMAVFSNMTAKPYGKSARDIANTLGKHLRNGVNFVDEIEAMYNAGARTFIEIGPGATLTNFVGTILGDKPHHAVATQPRSGKSGVDMLYECLAVLHACGYDIDLKPAFSCRRIADPKSQPEPSPTLFMVNGGRARPTMPFKSNKQPEAPKSSRWAEQPPIPAAAMTADTRPGQVKEIVNHGTKPDITPVQATPAPQSDTAGAMQQQLADTHAGAMSMQLGSVAAPISSDQEKLKKMKYFQQSMNLFLETQERFQKQRNEMMEKMWQINQQLFQGLLGNNSALSMTPATQPVQQPLQIPNAAQATAEQWAAMQQNCPVPPQLVTQESVTMPEPAPAVPAAPAATPVAENNVKPAAPDITTEKLDFEKVLFDIISERTQYPVDMLAPEQEIEADLGIDSIKRVEIISMLQEVHPALSDIADEKYFEDMAQLKTLGDIVNWLKNNFGSAIATVENAAVNQSTATAAQPAPVALDYQKLLFDIISERTQYPVDMLSPEQEIEGDLGIDSIKRVEIISMLQETDPALADIADEKYFEDMAQLKTLGDIVNWLKNNFGGAVAAAPAGQPAIQQAAQAQPASGQVDYQALLFEVISDRTQYPVDMLSPEQEIEGDLGIDSIKRVEIISMLESTHPSLADISNEKYFEDMAQLKSLGDIVSWLKSNFGAAVAVSEEGQPTVQQTPPAQQTPALVDYQTLLFEVISDRTQYPVDMLSPEQEIEGDLGIDSIKRVEIISMLESTHPSLADISNEKYFEDMAQLKTLGDIINWLKNNFGASQPEATPEPAAALPAQPPKTAQADGEIDYQTLLFQVISDRTQYPVDMLSREQEIDGDLGIDSIKRVEIISMLQEAHPSLSDIGDEKYFEELAQMKTLGDVVSWIKAHCSGTPPAQSPHSEATATAPSAAERAPLQPKAPLPNCRNLVIEAISERTLYPSELVKTDMNLERDLGIDANLLRELMRMILDSRPIMTPGADQKNEVTIQRLKTVQDLVNWAEQVTAIDTTEEMPHSVAPAQPEEHFHRILLKLVERPLDAGSQCAANGVLVILDGGNPVCAQLQKVTEKMGLQSVRIIHGAGTDTHNGNCIGLESVDEAHCQAAYQQIKDKYGRPAGVLNMLALGRQTHEAGYEAVLNTFYWAKTIGADKALAPYDQRQFFWTSISGMGGDFGLNNTMYFEACHNGPHGITKSLFHEWPGLRAKTIDIDATGDPEQLSRAIINECLEPNTSPKEVGLQGAKRYEIAMVIQPLEHETEPSRFNNESVFLITGGAKGITADVAKQMAELYAPTIILTGRTPLPERTAREMDEFMAQAASAEQDPRSFKSKIIEAFKSKGEKVSPSQINGRFNAIMNEYKARQNIAAMERLNARVFYYACDCTNDEAFSDLIRQVYQKHQKIDGVIHAAGYLKDGQITMKTAESFKRVIDTKVKGARTLINELDFEKLDFIAFFSSVAGRFGNQGQSDYAAANEILNKMAVKLNHQWPGKATAINWGPWEGEGMVSDQVKKQFAEAGIYLLPRDTGARWFNKEINLSARSAEVVVFGADDIEKRLPVIRQSNNGVVLPFAEQFVPVPTTENDQLTWELTLDQNAPYLNDHRINGYTVLPAAVAMEIMAQAAVITKPGYRFNGIHDFRSIRGITLPSDEPVKLFVTARASKNGFKGGVVVQVQLKTSDQDEWNNYSSSVILARTNGRGKEIPAITPYKHSQRFELPLEQVYQIRLFHDGVFRAIKTIESYEIADLENNGIRGCITTSNPEHILGRPTQGKWLVDPIAFDCAYQLTQLWIHECYGSIALPGDIKKYVQYRAYNGSPIYCDVNVKLAGFPKVILDFNFTDEAGRLYAKAFDATAIMKRTLVKRISGNPESDNDLLVEAN